MIISCPNCKTRFKTSAKAIGPNGRSVRCAGCQTTWFVPAEEVALTPDILALQDIEDSQNEVEMQAEETKSALRKGLSEQSKHAAALGTGRGVDKAAVTTAAWTGEDIKQSTARGAHISMRDRTERKRSRRRLFNVMLIWFIPLILLSALAVGAFNYRQDIVDRFPKSASLYQALGIEVSALGLSLTPPVTRYAQIDGKAVLVIEGELKNISTETLPLPLVALSLHNSSGQQVADWNVELEAVQLDAGASASYLSQYPAPPLDAVELRTKFADERSGLSTPVDIYTPEKP